MQNKFKKGFVWLPILLGVLALLVISGGAYWWMHHGVIFQPSGSQDIPSTSTTQTSQLQQNTPVTQATQNQVPSATQTQTSSATQITQRPADPNLCDRVPTGADPATFQNKSIAQGDFDECIGIDAQHIFVNNQLVSGSNSSQFAILPPNGTKMCQYFFRIQGAGVYAGVWLIQGANPQTFVDLTSSDTSATQGATCYGKDTTRVYMDTGQPSVISGADPNTFVVFNSNYTRDANSAWFLGGEYDKGAPIPGSDAKTFVGLSDSYAKDAIHVYNTDKIIAGADAATFTLLSYGFAKDTNHVYAGTTPLPDIDPASVVVLDNAWLKDKNHVYATPFLFSVPGSNSAIVSQADPATFVALGLGYGKDSSNVFWSGYYHDSAIVQGADAKTFTVVGTYAKDSNNIYDMGHVLADADVATFHQVGSSIFFADKSHVWTTGEIGTGAMGEIQGADPNTFVLTGTDTAKDANHTYTFSAKGYLFIDGQQE